MKPKNNMADLTLQKVNKIYPGGMHAVTDVSFDVADGEFIVIVGPSGCGKSTLIRLVAGLEAITDGTIQIGGREVNRIEPAERDIAMVFQNYALYPHMKVFNNMAYGLRNRGMPKAEIKQRVAEASKLLQLEGLLDRSPRQLSGGQRQRVAMGRAIVRQPQVFLFDEPLSNLDAKLRVQMRLEIKRLQQRLRTTSLYVTHDQVEAMTLADRLVVMNAGHTEQIGKPLELYEQPLTPFVAGFIGSPSMNLINTKISTDGRGVNLPSGSSIKLPLSGESEQPVILGLRPEHLRLATEQDKLGTMQLNLLERLGADTLAHGHLGDDQTLMSVRLPGLHAATEGDSLPITIDPEHVHVFDASTGQRLN